MLESFLKKVAGLKAPTHVFSCIYCGIFKTICFEKHLRTAAFLLFQWFKTNSEMGLKVQGLDCMTASGFTVFSAFIFFVFKSASPVLNQVPNGFRIPKTNIFDESIKILDWLFLVVLDGFRSL